MNGRRRILKRGTEIGRDHREDFTTCPHCRHKMDCDAWLASSHTLSLQPRFIRLLSVAITSTCPQCGEGSWVHEPMEEFSEFAVPASWKKAVKAQLAEEGPIGF